MNLTYYNGFHVRDDSEKLEGQAVLSEFRKEHQESMIKYNDLLDKEYVILQERKKLLADLKDDFKEFVLESYPESLL